MEYLVGNDYEQLIGALGCLLKNGYEILPRDELHAILRKICREGDNDKVYELKRKYRRECLDKGIIKIGYLFNQDDSDYLHRNYMA